MSYQCDQCDEEFETERGLKTHQTHKSGHETTYEDKDMEEFRVDQDDDADPVQDDEGDRAADPDPDRDQDRDDDHDDRSTDRSDQDDELAPLNFGGNDDPATGNETVYGKEPEPSTTDDEEQDDDQPQVASDSTPSKTGGTTTPHDDRASIEFSQDFWKTPHKAVNMLTQAAGADELTDEELETLAEASKNGYDELLPEEYKLQGGVVAVCLGLVFPHMKAMMRGRKQEEQRQEREQDAEQGGASSSGEEPEFDGDLDLQ